MIDAENRQSPERNAVREGHKGLAERLRRPIMVEVFRIDVGHNADHWGQAKERTIAFIGFGNQSGPCAQSGAAPMGTTEDATTDDSSGI